MKKSPTTVSSFRRKAEAAFRRANKDSGATVEWKHGPVKVVWADGSTGFTGTFVARGEGFRSKLMIATLTGGVLAVR